jgi:hypothetical protein
MQAAKELRSIIKFCGSIKTKEEAISFLTNYKNWHKANYEIYFNNANIFNCVQRFKKNDDFNRQCFKRYVLLYQRPKSNYIENFFKHLKHKYRGHNGLLVKHKIAYLNWYCFYKNIQF